MIVADGGPLIAFALLRQLDLLRTLYKSVLVPRDSDKMEMEPLMMTMRFSGLPRFVVAMSMALILGAVGCGASKPSTGTGGVGFSTGGRGGGTGGANGGAGVAGMNGGTGGALGGAGSGGAVGGAAGANGGAASGGSVGGMPGGGAGAGTGGASAGTGTGGGLGSGGVQGGSGGRAPGSGGASGGIGGAVTGTGGGAGVTGGAGTGGTASGGSVGSGGTVSGGSGGSASGGSIGGGGSASGGSIGSGGAGGGSVAPGVLAWARRSTGGRTDRARGLAMDAGGNIYVGGTFFSNVVFWDGQTDQRAVTGTLNSYDMFLAKVTPTGGLEWLKTAGNASESDEVLAVAGLDQGVLVAGRHGNSTAGEFILGPGEPSQIKLTLNGFFFARYRADGSLAWGRSTGGNHFGEVHRIAATAEGGLVAVGQFNRTMTFGPGEPNQTTLVNEDTQVNDDGYVARFGNSGNLEWALQIRGPERDLVQDVQIAADGSAIVVGVFAGTTVLPNRGGASVALTVAPGDGIDMFIAAYGPTGGLRWVRQVSGPAQVDSHCLALMPAGGFVVSGTITPSVVPSIGRAVFGPGEAGETALTGTYFDMFLARYDAEGRLLWARLAPGARPYPHTIVVQPGGSIVVPGNFGNSGVPPRNDAVFGPGEPGETTLQRLPGPDRMNTFIAQYRPDGTFEKVRIVAHGEWLFLSGAAALPAGGIVVAGGYGGHIVLGPQDSSPVTFVKAGPTTVGNIGTQDVVVAAFSP